MNRWMFKDYVHPNGNNPVRKWYTKELSTQEQANMDALLGILGRTEIWGLRDYKPLQGAQKGLGEIRWKGDQRRQLRLIGFFGPAPRQFTLLVGCNHKGTVYDPANALETAATLFKRLNQCIGEAREHEIEPDPKAQEE